VYALEATYYLFDPQNISIDYCRKKEEGNKEKIKIGMKLKVSFSQ
jgi:hypothetical protein